jgi:hypothetical protein
MQKFSSNRNFDIWGKFPVSAQFAARMILPAQTWRYKHYSPAGSSIIAARKLPDSRLAGVATAAAILS